MALGLLTTIDDTGSGIYLVNLKFFNCILIYQRA
jgi:hypothetical protein